MYPSEPPNRNTAVTSIKALVEQLPSGYSEVYFDGSRYGMTKSAYASGKSVKVYARQLGGTDYISFNYYTTDDSDYLKPCEMPEAKVVDFLNRLSLCSTEVDNDSD